MCVSTFGAEACYTCARCGVESNTALRADAMLQDWTLLEMTWDELQPCQAGLVLQRADVASDLSHLLDTLFSMS